MCLSASLSLGHPALTEIAGFSPKILPENTVIIGVRDIDNEEKDLIKKSGVKTCLP